MRRPSFQFYPGDWQSNTNLRRCNHAEKGVWLDVMCLLHDSEEYGVLRWTLKEIAQAVGCRLVELKALVTKGVLKGADVGASCEAFIYTPRSGRKNGDPVTLIAAQEGPVWYSSRMVRDEYVRTIRGESSRFGDGNDDASKGRQIKGNGEPPNGAPNPPFGDGSSTASASSPSGTTPVPDGTDAGASPAMPAGLDAKDAIFQVAVPWMVERGVPDKSARSLLGGAMKQFGDDGAWDLAQRLMRERPMEPAAWLAGAINKSMGKGASKHGNFSKQDYRAGVSEDGAF